MQQIEVAKQNRPKVYVGRTSGKFRPYWVLKLPEGSFGAASFIIVKVPPEMVNCFECEKKALLCLEMTRWASTIEQYNEYELRWR
jgi:hypothetical protein